MEAARRLEAKLLELEAAISLARLYGGSNRKAKARELLSGVYGWFTEGFGTPLLRSARATVEALAN